MIRSKMVKQLPPRHKLTRSTGQEVEQLMSIINQQTTIIKALVQDVEELNNRVAQLENP